MRYVDMHCDTITVLKADGEGLFANKHHIDIEKLKKNDALLQCFAIFVSMIDEDTVLTTAETYDYFNECLQYYLQELNKNREFIAPVKCYSDIMANKEAGKISAMLTLEDGAPIGGKIERVKELYDKGVRLITLTWNFENSLAYPNGTNLGLKPFGFETLEEMNRLGIIADVSHLSDQGFWDVASHSAKPFVASHSNARALCGMSRNLTDEMLHALGEKGGIAGINFYSKFLQEDSMHTRVEDIVRHARYMADKAGVDAVALGSDFDGIDCGLEFHDYSGMPRIEEALNMVFTASEVDKITHENALRVLKECLS